ncbi:MAG: SNF2-related protein [Verrucomicrobiales bacterium]|nr:SNF2-related protein [Verrucomicrobiales bacterium]
MKASRYQTDTADPSQFAPGQRWVSETQTEYGLALILKCDSTIVQAFFPAVGETLSYAARNAPLRRVVFEAGDTVKDQEGNSFSVSDVREENKCLIYVDGEGNELAESALSDTMNVQRPEQRLLSGVSDEPRLWSLRQSAIRNQQEARSRDIRGLVGARVSLIPHQLYIAEEVANRQAPRVLLADEVGLGKTIEACLILQRLHLSGRAKRILILLPDALVNQWFVELYRRFAMSFAIFDEERATAIENGGTEGEEMPEKAVNPFFDDQLVLCATSWLAGNPKRALQAAEAEWDLTIIDEAHHLAWTEESSSPEYDAIEKIAEKSAGLLLLTATPEQLGQEGHFARLRLLDPARFSDLKEFVKESEQYRVISDLADRLNGEETLRKTDLKQVEKLLGKEIADKLADVDTPALRESCRTSLIDLHGPGRVLFRNRRIVLDTFPQRIAHLIPLAVDPEDSFVMKMDWLAGLLRKDPDSKFLLITHARETVEAIEASLKERISAQATMFHEGLSLLQRDKNAAWFADEEMGARLLIASEIGSEGRNFQFAQNLILFDLPTDPGLLEQRIGRLDRIGQTGDIHIHIPFVEGTAEELKAMWYHNGLGAFEHTLHGSGPIQREFSDEIDRLCEASPAERESALPALLDRTRDFKKQIDAELEKGRDHLLEVSSFDRDTGEALVSQIEDIDEDTRLEFLMLKLFDHFGVTVEDIEERCYLLLPEHLFSAEAFPGLPEEGLSVTFSREVALKREEITFLSADHPMVISAMDSFLSKDHGNSAFFRLEKAGEQLLMVETVSILECIAPAHLHADRFLPSKPIRQIVDQKGRNRTEDFPIERIRSDGRPGPSTFLRDKAKALKGAVPPIMEVAANESEDIADEFRSQAIETMTEQYDAEIERLKRLREMGHPVRDSEIEMAEAEKKDLKKYLGDTPLKVDSVRLILAMT